MGRTAALMLVLAIAMPAFATDFWQTKDPEAWSDKELTKIRTRSPWARQAPQERLVTKMTRVQAPVIAPTTKAKKNTTTTAKTTTKKVWEHLVEAQFRWESAPPLLAATARVDAKLSKAYNQLAPDYYLVSLTGFEFPKGNAAEVADDINAHSSLHLGDIVVKPAAVKALDSGHGAFFLIMFPRDGRIERIGGTIGVFVQLGSTRASTEFRVKDMSFQGQLKL